MPIVQNILHVQGGSAQAAALFDWRRIGMIKPPVQLGVDKKYFSEEKEPPVLE